MKIVFTTDSISRGGKERQLFILTRNLLERGIQVSILTRNFSKENYLLEYGFNNSICNIYKGKTKLREFHYFTKLVISEKPDIILSWDFQTSLFALLLHKKYDYIFINGSIQHGIRLLRLSHILRSIICFLSPYVIANSFAGLRANNLKPGKRNFVLYNGIENKFINALTKKDLEIKRNQLIPGYTENPGTVYITLANLVPYKDYFTVLKALNKLKELIPFYYIIVGDGPKRENILMTIKDYGLEKRVILTGKIENVRDYLFISNIMIHSSRGEGISNAILEGMYAGLPVIATSVGGTPEAVFPASSLMFPYKDEKSLLECLLKSPKVFANFKKDSEEYKKHLEKFSVETMVKKFEEIIETVFNEAEGTRQ
jgi:glycosyltransferase involved in cell wall biosynthesis